MLQTAVLDYAGASHIGHVRQENQDIWKVLEPLGAFIVADGMGGRKGGRLAAQLAVLTLSQYLETQQFFEEDAQKAVKIISQGIRAANQAVFEQGQQRLDLAGMGTTLAAMWVVTTAVICAHVGDSRIYCLRDQQLKRLTEDHTVVNEGLVQELKESSKHILSRAVGISSHVEPSIISYPVHPGDVFMLCTDGLTNAVSEEEMSRILMEDVSVDVKAKLLVQTALNLGGKDNITLIVVKFK